MGTTSLMLTVLAFAAPIAVVTGFIPIAIKYGGEGATFGLLLTTVVLLIFSTGFVAMSAAIATPGAFYIYVTAGLGKTLGIAGAYLTLASYYFILVASYAFFGVLLGDMIASFGGPAFPWYLWAGLGWIITSILGHFHIEASARLLIAAMVVEIGLILLFDLRTIASVGISNLSLTPLTPQSLVGVNIPITLLFCVLMFLGFEATAVFRDEVRNPDRTIPRATYGAVAAIGLLQALSSYSLLIFYGEHASAIAASNPTSMFPHAIGTVISPKFVQVTTTVVVLSQFAANISVHNVAARYFHSLACNGALPRFLAKVHTRHNSPYRASALVAILVAFTLVPYAGHNADPAILYSQLIAVGLIGLMCLMTLVSLACFGWFFRTGRPANVGIWRAYVAPIISFAGLGTIAALACLRFNLAFGGQAQQNNILFGLLIGAFAGGLGAATYLRIKRPTLFASFGGIDSKASDPNDRIPAMTSL